VLGEHRRERAGNNVFKSAVPWTLSFPEADTYFSVPMRMRLEALMLFERYIGVDYSGAATAGHWTVRVRSPAEITG
jgi:hypothetical protein